MQSIEPMLSFEDDFEDGEGLGEYLHWPGQAHFVVTVKLYKIKYIFWVVDIDNTEKQSRICLMLSM